MGRQDPVLDNALPSIGERKVTCSMCERETSTDRIEATDGRCPSCGSDICMICGCSDQIGCRRPCAGGAVRTCEWVEPGVCSFCYEKEIELIYKAACERFEQMKNAGMI